MNDKPEKTFPVKLAKNYRPVGKFMVEETVDGKPDLRDPTDVEVAKVPAGTIIHIGIDEAKIILGKTIGVRNDPIA